jgi:hypothetical protein
MLIDAMRYSLALTSLSRRNAHIARLADPMKRNRALMPTPLGGAVIRRLIEGFSHFVISMTAPIASGWSGCRVGLASVESGA